MSSIYEEIKKECKEAGVSVSQLCRDAGVDRFTIERWKKTPKSIETLMKLKKTLKTYKSEK